MEDFFKLIANFGFPIVVASFLLVRVEKNLKELADKIVGLSEAINKVCEKIDGDK